MKSRLGRGWGEERLMHPLRSGWAIRNSIAAAKSASWIHDKYWRPEPAAPPKPARTRFRSVSNAPPRSGAHDDPAAHGDLAGARRVGFEKRLLPPFSDLVAE